MKLLHRAIAVLCVSMATACGNGGGASSDNIAKSVANPSDGQAGNSLGDEARVTTNTLDTTDALSPFKSELDPQTATGRLVLAIQKANQIALLDINAALQSGQAMSENQLDCLGDYNAALGVPVVAINCVTPLALGTGIISTEHAAYYKTDVCLADLATGDISGCIVQRASFSVATQWIQHSDRNRPTPNIGAHIDYDAVTRTVTLGSLPQHLGGSFSCRISLRTAALDASDNAKRCDAEISRMTNSINALLTPQ